jgi:hypothetical protein
VIKDNNTNDSPKATKKQRTPVSPKMVSAERIAEMFDCSAGWLANMRVQKRGPAFYKVGSKILYDIEETTRYFRGNKVRTIDSIGG